MSHPWAADLVTTSLVLLLVDSLVPVTEHAARLAAGGAWPWLVTVLGFLALRLVVAGLYAVLRRVVERLFPRSPPAKASS